MSVELVNREILRFLGRIDPEVLCIRGKWGVGKTYTWVKHLQDAQASGKIALPRYSYVSLFGVNSLEELKFSVFENVVATNSGPLKADLNTLDAFVNSNLGSWRKLTRLAQSLPIVKSFIGGDAPALLSFLTIRDQIVCIDDLERRGRNLGVGEVLGLASFLKEQRNCKVVLLLNDSQLEGDAKATFETYFEKVVDVSVTYAPSSQEAVDIALPGTDVVSHRIASLCTVLGISNIRVIKKIEHHILAVHPQLIDFDPAVFDQISASLVLFGWARYQPEDAPTLEFLTTKEMRSVFGPKEIANLPEREAAWKALLEAYGYTWTDEFDLALIEGVRNGHFDPLTIGKYAKELHERIMATKADGSFEDAWRTYHDSFADDQDRVLDTIYASFLKNFNYISPLNLNGTVRLFKELGRTDQASHMIKYYIDNRNEERKFFDLSEYAFGGDITEKEVIEAFKAKFDAIEEKRDVLALLMSLRDDWNDDVLSELSTVPVEVYYRAFKYHTGMDLRRMLSGTLQFDRLTNASANMKEISRRARDALRQIGMESAINARRVSKYGIFVNDMIEKSVGSNAHSDSAQREN